MLGQHAHIVPTTGAWEMGRTQKTVFLGENYIKKSSGTMRIKMSFSLQKMNGRRPWLLFIVVGEGTSKSAQ